MLALSVAVLFSASVIPGIELTILALSGVFVMIIIGETSIKSGIIFYIAVMILSFLIVPDKSILLVYAFIFGPYSIIKTAIERKIKKKILGLIIKIVCFNILLGAGLVLFKEAFLAGVELPDLAWYLILAGAQIMFMLYDFILTFAVSIYERIIPVSIRGNY